MINKILKRLIDVILSMVLLIIFFPLMLWVAFKIKRNDGGPIFYCQQRIGKNLKNFEFYKFRSMILASEEIMANWESSKSEEWICYVENNFKLNNDPRITKIGRWIRSTSIDELPQLFNVIRGDMSLVGPRPLMLREKDDYGEENLSNYSKVKPGITGLWQVSGRSNTSFEKRIALDQLYIFKSSLISDVFILAKTVLVVFKKTGAV